MSGTISLDDAIQMAAKDLPTGWDIELHIQRGAGWIVLNNPEGEAVEVPYDDLTIATQIEIAVHFANGRRKIQCAGLCDIDLD